MQNIIILFQLWQIEGEENIYKKIYDTTKSYTTKDSKKVGFRMAERFPAEDSGHGSGSGGGDTADGSNPDGQEFSDNYSKYLILGGGMSGLSAAAHLANRGQGRHLKVLEARNRLGGRIMTFQIGQKGQTTAV